MMKKPSHFAVATQGILNNNRLLATALQADIALYQAKNTPQAILAWGQRPSAKKARLLADKLGLPLWTAEDGFLRSLDGGVLSRFGASFVLDDVGVYFDARQASRLESLIAWRTMNWDLSHQNRADALIKTLTEEEISKYNPALPSPTLAAGRLVLVIDQVFGDASIAGAGATQADFVSMLIAACQQNPDAKILIKAHPAAKLGFLVGEDGQLLPQVMQALNSHYLDDGQIQVLSQAINPIALLKQVQTVYTVSSHLGFEALLLNKVVHCFGVSWYAGFGQTNDAYLMQMPSLAKLYAQAKTRRSSMPSVAQLFFAAYIDYSHYANPATAKSCDIEEVVQYLCDNKKHQIRHQGVMMAYEFSRWKVPFVKRFMQLPQTTLLFKPKTKLRLLFSNRLNARRVARDEQMALAKYADCYLVWGLPAKMALADKLTQHHTKHRQIVCMEDGFIRSNGLGATLLEPVSVVLDDLGIYYDATQTSRLEQILANIHLNETQHQRADALIQTLLTKKVSKYNVGQALPEHLSAQIHAAKLAKPSATVRLVVGQVEDDASVRQCTSLICTNSQLLTQVRTDYPDDIIIYKPHPDVEAGLRVGQVDAATRALADFVAVDVAMPDCLAVAQVVHTISSLTGFEALLRGLTVVCYGLPFYAGFGLTQDVIEADNAPKIAAMTRRQRATPLSLTELVYGVLIEYPIYALPHGYGLATVEQAIAYLYDDKHAKSTPSLGKQISQTAKTAFMKGRKIYLQKIRQALGK
ncbi:capsular polysaccharide biosynthesis protein [Moraxella nasicaprae]|uniref:Capsular polysaccharide biosynthesis protein n=1 Tax=Moraxella nasicaprae TaxID=2904122 RepID=A0ABY6F701_9GAMM|nr:capsular polysaccharide biosynthesis protein [Moraxella nasicaprae]UXZ05702.1 capsular polysaccharide biosynthesis protein [Moraxella nasicaprae]